jgi:hypothetical protein
MIVGSRFWPFRFARPMCSLLQDSIGQHKIAQQHRSVWHLLSAVCWLALFHAFLSGIAFAQTEPILRDAPKPTRQSPPPDQPAKPDTANKMPTDTTATTQPHDSTQIDSSRHWFYGAAYQWPLPKRAARLSFLLPGLGQCYNRSYWKVPIVYAALGTTTFFILRNGQEYIRYRNAYRIRLDTDPTTFDEFDIRAGAGIAINNGNLKGLRDYYRQNRDLSILLTAIAYSLNALDAYVDAHLKHFDVSDNLSLRWQPLHSVAQPTMALQFSTGFVLTQKKPYSK